MTRPKSGLTPNGAVAVAGMLAFCMTGFMGIGGPPSEISERAGGWLALEPILFPSLVAGVVLSLLSILVAFVSVRGGALVCIAGLVSSAAGVIIGLGLEDRISLRVFVFPGVFLALPALVAIAAVQRSLREA